MPRSLAVALLCVLSTTAFAEQNPPPLYDCQTVRAFVAEHGKAAALAMALRNGATLAQIREARKCLAR